MEKRPMGTRRQEIESERGEGGKALCLRFSDGVIERRRGEQPARLAFLVEF